MSMIASSRPPYCAVLRDWVGDDVRTGVVLRRHITCKHTKLKQSRKEHVGETIPTEARLKGIAHRKCSKSSIAACRLVG